MHERKSLLNRRDVLRFCGASLALASTRGLLGEARAANNVHPAAGGLAAAAFDNRQFILYRDGADRLCQLVWNRRWYFADLSSSPVVKAPPIKGTPAIVQLGDSLHVFYRTKFNKLAELYMSPSTRGTWRHSDLTKAAGIDANVASDPAAWVFGNGLHAIYYSSDNKLHEVYWSNNAWRHGRPGRSQHDIAYVPTHAAAAATGSSQYILTLGPSVSSVAPGISDNVQFIRWPDQDNTWAYANPLLKRDGLSQFALGLGDGTGNASNRGNENIVGFSGLSAVTDGGGIRPCVRVKLRDNSQYWISPKKTLSTSTNQIAREPFDLGDWYRIGKDDFPEAAKLVEHDGKMVGAFTRGGVIYLGRYGGDDRDSPMREAGVSAPPTTKPTIWTVGDSLHIAYTTSDGHIHELTRDSSWRHRDLTQLASA